MTTHEIAQNTMRLYRQFLHEHNVTPESVYANILWLWPEYLASHKCLK